MIIEEAQLQELLAQFQQAPGYRKYADLLAMRYGGPAEDFLPYLSAVSLEVALHFAGQIASELGRAADDGGVKLGIALVATAETLEHFSRLWKLASRQVGVDQDAEVQQAVESAEDKEWPGVIDIDDIEGVN